jgi:hypothetical protein
LETRLNICGTLEEQKTDNYSKQDWIFFLYIGWSANWQLTQSRLKFSRTLDEQQTDNLSNHE